MDDFPGLRFLGRTYHLLGRIDVAVIIIVSVLLLATVGSWFPQSSPPATTEPETQRRWQEAVRRRYGALADLLMATGIFRWFTSPLFTASIVLLSTSIAACTLQRWHSVWHRAFQRPVLCSDAVFCEAPLSARGDLASGTVASCSVRAALERHGFLVQTQCQGDFTWMRGDRNRLAPLGTLVSHLGVLVLLLGIGMSGTFAWREQVMIEPGDSVKIGHDTGLVVGNLGFVISRYPDGSAAGYRADVGIADGNREARHESIHVGEPLTLEDVTIYLRGFTQTETGAKLTLLAVHDPGYTVVILAGLFLLLGMTVTFNFPRCWVRARLEPGGMLRMAGWGDRRAWDFESEFHAIVREVGLSPRPANGECN